MVFVGSFTGVSPRWLGHLSDTRSGPDPEVNDVTEKYEDKIFPGVTVKPGGQRKTRGVWSTDCQECIDFQEFIDCQEFIGGKGLHTNGVGYRYPWNSLPNPLNHDI